MVPPLLKIKSIFHNISANIAYNCTNKLSKPTFSWSEIINYKTIPELTTRVLCILCKFWSGSIAENV